MCALFVPCGPRNVTLSVSANKDEPTHLAQLWHRVSKIMYEEPEARGLGVPSLKNPAVQRQREEHRAGLLPGGAEHGGQTCGVCGRSRGRRMAVRAAGLMCVPSPRAPRA